MAAKKPLRALSPFLAWPPAIARQPAGLRKLVDGLVDSQWWSRDEIETGWAAQLQLLLGWATANVEFYKSDPRWLDGLKRLQGPKADFWSTWRSLPLLTKPDLHQHRDRLRTARLPPHHAPAQPVRTSGSTGIPVETLSTAVTGRNWGALTIRDHLAWKRDFSKRMGAIRFLPPEGRDPNGVAMRDWGWPVKALYTSSPGSAIHMAHPPEVLARWLHRVDPVYLLTYPSIAAALLDAMGATGRPRSLREIRFMSEPLDAELEQRLQGAWNIRCADMYSANETGHIAQDCPEHGRLHVQAETVCVEIIRDDGEPCAAGETGRVVLSSLHNLAMPLLRYDLGDYATVGEPCACGRGAPVIARVMGRVRNYARTPDGHRFWPGSLGKLSAIEAIVQFQYVQTALDSIELRVVTSRPLSAEESTSAAELVQAALGYPYQVQIKTVEQIERGPTGKYEEFLSLINDN
ncbi:MAG: phenylacetate--CoA ligase family protein [Chromatiales bacterium]|nr:phenylacetate--CoA ligase family protein [Chromatiales bacterium]